MKKIFKKILESSIFYRTYQNLKDLKKNDIISFLYIFMPILATFIVINSTIILFSILIWDLPIWWYKPFFGGYAQDIFDRALIIIGIIFWIFVDD